MKPLSIALLFIILFSACQPGPEQTSQNGTSDTLEISYTGDGEVVEFKMFGGLSQILKKDAATGAFIGTLQIPMLNEAIFTYDIVVQQKDASGQMLDSEPHDSLIRLNQQTAIRERGRFLWIGDNRGTPHIANKVLSGKVVTRNINSKFLGEERAVTVYTPKETNSTTPHIYFTDGSSVNRYAPYVDHLITTQKIRPVKLIGIHSSHSHRYEEYVQGRKDNEQFNQHQEFFYEEVMSPIEQEIESWKGDRFLFGYSNGAAFCIHAGLNHPDKFKEVIAFSTADYISRMARWMNPIKFKFDDYPTFYMGAGRYEESIFKDNTKFQKILEDHDIEVTFKAFISGHDFNVWRVEFLEYLEKQFQN